MLLHLNVLANLVLADYFIDSRCLLIFSDNRNFNYTGNLPTVRIAIENKTFDENVLFGRHFGCQGIFIYTDHPITTFVYFENRIRFHMDRFNYRKYIILPTENMEEDMMGILDTEEIEYVADLVLIQPRIKGDNQNIWKLQDANVSFDLYTHRFVGDVNHNEAIHLDEWHSINSTFTHGNNLYPDKLKNGEGRVWKIATFSYKPYSVPATNEGTELELALYYVAKHNLTPYLVIDEEGEWGEIYDNWTGYGILGNVLNDNGDVGLAALYTWSHEYGFLDLSKPVVRTGITCLTPAPRLASGWLVPLFSFTYEMWIAVGLSFVICATSLFCLDFYKETAIQYKQYRKNRRQKKKITLIQQAILHTAAVFLLQSLVLTDDSLVKDQFKKYLFGCMFIFCLIITTSYSGGLASSMTVPRYVGAIKTVEDLVASGIQWGATSIAWIMSIMDAAEDKYVILVQRFVKTDGPRLRKYNNKRFAFSIERLPAGYFAIGDYITEEGVNDLRLMSQDIYWEQCVLMTKKSSIWMPSLDDFVLIIQQTGIASTWEFRVATTHLNAKIQRAVKFSSHHSESSGPVKLTWNHVQGAFGILMTGISVSSLAFILECIVKRHEIRLFRTATTVNFD